MAEENKTAPKKSNLFLIVITILATALVVGGIFFFYSKYSSLKDDLKNAQNTATASPKTTQTAIPNEPSVSPSTVVNNYMKATIGTIPGGNVNDTEAKTYLTDVLKAQYTDSTFAKTSYGIVNQNWPNKIKIDSESIGDNSGNIKISGNWSDISTSWEDFCTFTLVKEDNEWKISNIENHLEDDEFRIPEGF